MLGDNTPVLADDDAIRIGVNFDGTTDSAGSYRVLVVVEAYQAGLRDRCRHRVESIEPASIGNELRALGFEHLPDRLFGQFRMAMRLGVGDALVQPGVWTPNDRMTTTPLCQFWPKIRLIEIPLLATPPS